MKSVYESVMDFIKKCPLVGEDTFFNFVDETNNDGNTTLATVPYGQLVKKYVDGECLMKLQFEIRQVKPLAQYSNTNANIDEMQKVKEFLDWVNLQGKIKNFPDFEKNMLVQSLGTPEGVAYPSMAGRADDKALYAFPFEIIYKERK